MVPIINFYTPGYARLNALEPRELPRDHGGATADAKRGRTIGTAGSERRSLRLCLCIGQQSSGGECIEGNAPLTVQRLSEILRG